MKRRFIIGLKKLIKSVIKNDFCGMAAEMGASEALTTISPDNPYSYRNFLVLNFDIVDERELYGGKRRYILRKTF